MTEAKPPSGAGSGASGPDQPSAAGAGSGASGPSATDTFSLAKLVLYALGGGALVLVVATPIVLVVAPHSPLAALIVAVIALVCMVVVIALVSRRMTAGITAELEAHRARQRPGGGDS